MRGTDVSRQKFKKKKKPYASGGRQNLKIEKSDKFDYNGRLERSAII